MPDINIHRDHQLGLPRAREVAWKWAEKAEEKFEMECSRVESDDGDTVEFKRAGVDGVLRVTADSFELSAKLGFLLGAFAKKIEGEIERNLDALLAEEQGGAATAGAHKT